MLGDIIVGILMVSLGLMVCFAGLRLFFVMLPIVGFVSGFFVGAAGVTAIFGDRFLATALGVIVGLIVGVVFGALAYFFWYIGALLSAGSTGALFGSGLMHALGVESGWGVFLGAAIGAVLLFLLAMMLALPIWVVIVNTAFVGAAAVITGALVVFNQTERSELGYGASWAMIEESWFYLIAWIVLTVAGLVSQSRMIAQVSLPDDRWSTATPTTTTTTA